MGKTRVIEIYLDNTFEEKKVQFEANKLKPKKGEEVQFEPICVFKERKKRGLFAWFPFLKSRKSLIFYVNGAYRALRFTKVTDKLQPLWTKKESKQFVKKEIAKAHQEYKPMTWTQFGILLAVNVGILIAVLALMQRLRIF